MAVMKWIAVFIQDLPRQVVANEDLVSTKIFKSCQSLLDATSCVESVQFNDVDLSCLYYFAGYVVAKVLKHDKATAVVIPA